MPYDFTKNLTEKLGPLPGYAWVGIGLGAVYLYRKRRGSSSMLSSNSAAPIPSSATPATDPNAESGSGTNVDWATQVARNLHSSSAYSPSDIYAALSNYISGAGLSGQQSAIIAAAILGNGNAPEGVGSSFSGNSGNNADGSVIPDFYLPTILTTPDATPGYNNPPGFGGLAALDGANNTALNPLAPTYTPPVTDLWNPLSPTYYPTFTTPTLAPTQAPTNNVISGLDAMYAGRDIGAVQTTPAAPTPTPTPTPTTVGAGSGNARVS